jgi:hypothetical protein
MKQIALFFFMLIACAVFAQSEGYRSTASLQTGLNGYMLLSRIVADGIEYTDANGIVATVNSTATPTFGLSYDYGFSKLFSLGISFGYNSLSVSSNNLAYIDANGTTRTDGIFDLNLRRFNIAIRPLFHYGKNPKLDMYSGLRLGISSWSGGLDTNIPELETDEIAASSFLGINPGVALIPFGLRYYFTDNFGAGFETHIGPPYWGNIQVNYRF